MNTPKKEEYALISLKELQDIFHCTKESEINKISNEIESIHEIIVGKGTLEETSLVATIRKINYTLAALSEQITKNTNLLYGNEKPGLKDKVLDLEQDYQRRKEDKEETKKRMWQVNLLLLASLVTAAKVFLWDMVKHLFAHD